MWYFAWILGVGLAACMGIISGLWYESNHESDVTTHAGN